MILIIIFVLIFLLFALSVAGIKFNLTNPLSLLWGTWLFSIGICVTKIFSVYPSLSVKCYLFIFSFLIITSLAFVVGKSLPIKFTDTKYNYLRLFYSFNILFMVVIFAYVITIIKLGLPPLFSGSVRSQYYLSNGGELLYLLVYPCFFLGLFIIYNYKKHPFNGYIYTQLLILLFVIFTRGNKMTIFAIILMFCFYWGKQISLAKLTTLLLLIIAIFLLVSVTYKKNIQNLSALKVARINITGFRLPSNYYFLYDPLIYMSSNIDNLNSLINTRLSGIGLGTLSFKGIYQIIAVFNPSITDLSRQTLINANASLTVPQFSTYSGLGLLYYDFGPLISLETFMLIGFTSGALYNKNSMNLTLMFFSFILFQTLALSFFSFYLGNLEVITNIIFMIIIDLYARNAENNADLLGGYYE